MQTKKTRNLVMISVLAAMSFILMYAVQIPLLAAAPFLKWDPSDLPNVLGGFVLGPWAATVIAFIKCLLFLIFKGSEGPIGAFMAFASSAALAVPFSFIYRRRQDYLGFFLGLVAGTLSLALTMVFVNYYFALGAWGIPEAARAGLVKTAVLPFNLLRGIISSLLIYPVYLSVRKPLSRLLETKTA